MEIAQALLVLWRRKIWVAIGVVVALAAGVASVKMLKKEVYATAATQMIVDSPRSPLGDASASLDPFVARASLFANMMASPPAVAAIGRAAGIPADQLVATGPVGTGQTPAPSATATPTPTVTNFKLFLDQDPTLPTVDIYAQAPTTRQAIALANGAVTGFDNYLRTVENQTSIAANQRVEIRQLGQAIGGVVNPGSNKKLAAIIFVLVLVIWCGVILLIERLRGGRREPAAMPGVPLLHDDDDLYSLPSHEWLSEPASDLRIDPKNGDGRKGTQVNHRLTAEPDATLAEFSEHIAALAEPSPAPDEG